MFNLTTVAFARGLLFRYAVKHKSITTCIMVKRYSNQQPAKKKIKLSHNYSAGNGVSSLNKTIGYSVDCHSKHNRKREHVENNMQTVRVENENFEDDTSNIDIKVQYLENPRQSENDKKEYRVIQLPNGLTALLIADIHRLTKCQADGALENDEVDRVSAASSTENEDSEEESSEEEDDAHDEDDDEDDNEARITKAPKKEEKMAACALCVGVGSFSDPPEIPGLAHFLEHMVFMGSKKYPAENDFDAFIKKHGGSDNAHTDCEHTTFYFEVDEKHFFPALDRFAQFFVSPLMLRDAITREREAVESEFQMALPSDYYRKEQLFCSLAQENHPATKFTWGNLTTLRDNVEDDKLYQELHKFHERHYSAHRMTLAIQARLTLDKLEEYVKKCFAGVPTNGLPADDFTKFIGTQSFDTPRFRRIYKTKPSKDICQVELTWVMPPMLDLYKSKPHQYVSWIIGHEGKGSLITYLRKKMWCLDIFSGNGESDFEHSSMYALFSLSLILSEEGYKHLKEVLDAIFSYINMMRKVGPQQRLYDEIRLIEEASFRFAGEEEPVEVVEELSENMHFYKPIDYMTGSNLYFEYDPKSISKCMDILTPDNVNIIISNKTFDDTTFEKVEPWFGTKYTDNEIPREWIEYWRTIEPISHFFLPLPNIYITDDFSLINAESTTYPMKIHEDNLSEIWYKADSKFRLPECYIKFYLISPMIRESPENACMLAIMTGVLKLLLVEELYSAVTAELSWDICNAMDGLILKVSGFNQKLPLLLETICKCISNCSDQITEDLFFLVKSEQLKSYYNKMLKPKKLVQDVRVCTLVQTVATKFQLHAACTEIAFDQFQYFVKNYMKHIYVKCLVQGNMEQKISLDNVLKCIKILNCEPLLPNTYPIARTMSLPTGVRYCRLKNFNPTDLNSVVTNYYQSDLASYKLQAIIDLIMIIMEEPLFNQLRTKEQLGYDVFNKKRDTFGVVGFTVTVCTQADKFSVDHIDNRIEEFLKSFNESMKNMPEEEFEHFKETLIKYKQCVHVNLNEEVEKYWGEIIDGEYQFDRTEREIEEIRKIDIHELRSWMENNSLGGENFRKLSVQVVGIGENEEIIDEKCEISENITQDVEQTDRKKTTYTLQYLSDIPKENTMEQCKIFIKDIGEFQRSLYAYPSTCRVPNIVAEEK